MMTTQVVGVTSRFSMSSSRRFNIGLACLIILIVAFGGLTQDQFLTSDNMIAVVRASALIGIAAVGMTFITLSGNFVSLATEQTAIISAILFAMALSAGWPLWPSIFVTIAVSLVLGLVQGWIVSLGLNSIVTSLGAGAAIFGLANVITDNRTIQARSTVADWLGTSRPLGIPIQVWIFICLTVVTMVVLKKTSFGRRVTLVGSNIETAKASGIRVGHVVIYSFLIASSFAAICGILLVAQVGQAKVLNFENFNIDVVAAVLVGGTAIQGGEGSTLRTAFGAIAIALLTNYMLLSQFEYGTRLVITGLVVGVAVLAFNWVRKRSS